MKTLVTGASGFLGSHIVDECVRAGDSVRALVRPSSDLSHLRTVPGVEIVHGDLKDRASLRAATEGVDVVYHSAARVLDYGSRAQFWQSNVTATESLLEAARAGGAGRFVFVSSPSAVMTGEDQYDIDESRPYPQRHLNLYSETKAAAESIVLAADAPGFTTCAIRPRGVWGPRDWHGFMPKLLARMLDGRMPDLSGGRRVRTSLCYCTNAARACLLAARSGRVGGRAYFVADRERTDVWAFMARWPSASAGRRRPVRSRRWCAMRSSRRSSWRGGCRTWPTATRRRCPGTPWRCSPARPPTTRARPSGTSATGRRWTSRPGSTCSSSGWTRSAAPTRSSRK
ncbi:NAD-dependent epimerase/dehydratase family protein [Allosalinactinospora lopnorensis]|uniref:NAD-dependent epimerase/dehydratase family protein n=1 Tax=Allosalinactinospora lopnorensis TaxID=1352348 RepID=UPI00191C007D|nr:NAD-dependent epimerase/dehydratase family protein [Allosalinactinospora lopnorensis]